MKEMLNPWVIEVDKCSSNDSIRINIINQNTGEIRQVILSVEDINDINRLSVECIHKIAEKYFDDETDFSLMVDRLIGFNDSGAIYENN